MLSILVCHSYYLRLDQKQVARAKTLPAARHPAVVSLLRKSGHRVAFFDAMLADSMDEFDRLIQADRPQVVLFYEDNFNFLSKMCLAAMRQAACEMITTARRAGARVIAAGPDVTDAPTPYLRSGADLTLAGEGLAALLEVIIRLDGNPAAEGSDLIRGLSGAASLNGGKPVSGGRSRDPAVSNESGPAAWDLVDMDRYRAMWIKAHGYFSLNMAASRGCPFRCTWCAKPIWGNHYLQRNPGEVARGNGLPQADLQAGSHLFADDIFGFRVDWVREFGAAAQAADAVIPFTIQTRADLISERMAPGPARCPDAGRRG